MHPLFVRLRRSLTAVYEAREAHAVALRVLEDGFGVPPIDVYADKVRQFTAEETRRLDTISQRLRDGEPLQYVVGTAWFAGRKFHVGPGVLIPRPETEELAEWVAAEWEGRAPRLLDAGTGSGCIAVTLALRLPQARVEAWDVSGEALATARRNAADCGARVLFGRHDLLAPPPADRRFEVIVSNPPYVCARERAAMAERVVRHEPPQALFVPDADPLRFYRALVRLSAACLVPGGRLYVEINEAYGAETVSLLRGAGFGRVRLRQDFCGKDRMVSAERDGNRPLRIPENHTLS